MPETEVKECIYNLIAKPRSEQAKQPLYRSKHDPNTPLVGSTFGINGARNTGLGVTEIMKTQMVSSTMGPTCSDRKHVDPSNYLKKGSRATMPKYPTQHKCRVMQKPAVPSKDDRPVMGIKTKKDFVSHNAASAILSSPPKLKEDSGDFMCHEGYGKIPEYLTNVKQQIRLEQELIDRHVQEQFADKNAKEEEKLVPMDEAERQELINALKLRWDTVNNAYQMFGHRVAIENGDIKRKEAQEQELEQLEKDIEKLSRPGPVMIRQTG
jgi:hypothetical protein